MGKSKRVQLAIISFFLSLGVLAQEELIQVNGLVLDRDKEPIEFTTIILNNRKGTMADRMGRFSFVARPHDTISFSCMGFKKDTVIVPDDLEAPFLDLEITLRQDTIQIQEVIILPWKSYEDFREAFLNADIPDDNLKRARKNIALMKTQAIMDKSASPNVNFRNVMQEQYERTFHYGQMYPYISLFDPIAWSKFIKALQNGEFSDD